MFSKSALLHLRIPFSFFLMPIFLFSLAVSPNFNGPRMFWTFFIIHFLLYPATNGFNSYFDKDTSSIGGLKHPPATTKGLYYLSLLLDIVAIVLSLIKLNVTFTVMLLVYGLISKAYSHPTIRLKKYAFTGLMITGLFQGLFTFVMCYIGINDFELGQVWKYEVLIPGFLTTLMLWANYPMTQIYQHEEDRNRGDITASIRFGIKGTFYFAATVFGIAVVGFLLYFRIFYTWRYAWVFLIAIMPIFSYFIYWFLLVLKDKNNADYDRMMYLNYITGISLNAFFIYFFLKTTQLTQLFQ